MWKSVLEGSEVEIDLTYKIEAVLINNRYLTNNVVDNKVKNKKNIRNLVNSRFFIF